MKHVSIILLFLLVIVVNITFAQAGYSVEPHSSIRPGPVDSLGADRDVSFFELPLWIQIAEISGFLVALFSAIKFGPVLVGKVKTILQTKIRAEILEYIRRHPGCTIADLSKKTGINRGSVKYHLSVLVIERKIVRKKEGKLMFLFTNGGTDPEKKRMYGYIMSHPKQEMLKIIQNEPGISNKDIAERLGLDRSTVYWHLQQFLDEEMVESNWDGRNRNYCLTSEVEEILKKYRI